MSNDTYEDGILAFEQADYAKATKILEKFYEEKKSFKLNYLLFTAFKKIDEHEDASLIAEDYLLEYLKDDEKLAEYVKETILAGNVRGIQMTLKLLRNFMDKHEMTAFSNLFENTLAEVRKHQSKEIEDIKQQLTHLGALDILSQRKLLSKAGCLTIEEFQQAVINDLSDPYVHPLIRAAILDELRHLGRVEKVKYRLFSGEEQEFIPADLKEIDEYLMYQRLIEILKNDDTISEDMVPLVHAEIHLKLQLLYPKLAIYQDPKRLYRVLLQKEELSAEETELAHKLEKSLAQWSF